MLCGGFLLLATPIDLLKLRTSRGTSTFTLNIFWAKLLPRTFSLRGKISPLKDHFHLGCASLYLGHVSFPMKWRIWETRSFMVWGKFLTTPPRAKFPSCHFRLKRCLGWVRTSNLCPVCSVTDPHEWAPGQDYFGSLGSEDRLPPQLRGHWPKRFILTYRFFSWKQG